MRNNYLLKCLPAEDAEDIGAGHEEHCAVIEEQHTAESRIALAHQTADGLVVEPTFLHLLMDAVDRQIRRNLNNAISTFLVCFAFEFEKVFRFFQSHGEMKINKGRHQIRGSRQIPAPEDKK